MAAIDADASFRSLVDCFEKMENVLNCAGNPSKKLREDAKTSLEKNPTCRNLCLNMKFLRANWNVCKIQDFIAINRCFKYFDYHHKAVDCQNGLRCFKCAGEHKSSECNLSTQKKVYTSGVKQQFQKRVGLSGIALPSGAATNSFEKTINEVLFHSFPDDCHKEIWSDALINTNELWFQQDGATCHTARATIDLLKDTFGDRLISRFGPVNWPPRSCDLTPLDYFLWGYVKSLVYADKPQTLDHLEDNIRRVIADIRPQMLEKVIENWTSRLDYIRASRGNHMPEIIFKM
ncbi:uncharacterized protein TNCV_3928211 [Trichonephila clavipes]|nr:uncharacterized protein TNCV_3928211 [Trichonephila clavipes]